jgi:hypothetical protein
LPIVRPDVAAIRDADWVHNEIDTFILARLRQEQLQPAKAADRRTLIRRLSFDLLGLPPTPQQVQEFVQDKRPDAYQRLVQRILDSEHFGERMAMHWLDLVRYADTNGIHGDNHREHAPYRDWVINAFNSNMPFDRFTTEQLAGDLLPEAQTSQLVASGYNRLNMTTREGGAQPKEYMAKYAADRVRNVSSVWLGMTLGCAECHDHKFDPYTQRDFYSLAAFFADVKETAVGAQEPNLSVPSAEQIAQLAELSEQEASLRKPLDVSTPELEAAQATWEKLRRLFQTAWTPLVPATIDSDVAESDAIDSGATKASDLAASHVTSNQGATIDQLSDGSLRVSGKNPSTDTYTVTVDVPVAGMTALRLEVLPEDDLPERGPGRAGNGNFVLNRILLAIEGQPLEISAAGASHSQKGWDVAEAIDDDPRSGWAILPLSGQSHQAVFALKTPVPARDEQTASTPARLTISLHQNHGGSHTLGHFRLASTTAPRPIEALEKDSVPPEILEILKLAVANRSDQQQADLAKYYRTIAPALQGVRDQLAELDQQRGALEAAIPKTLITEAIDPRTMRLLPRGNWLDESGPVVEPATPGCMQPLEVTQRRANRLDLAQWLTSDENPKVARVFVNRLWKMMFARGLVSTLDDFGSQGAWPTHPELLDYLASEFIQSGWDVKHVLRLMALSATYRQSSDPTELQLQRDPKNHWLAHQNRARLDAELIRDNALAVSGLLVPTVGGPSVKPYQPAGYWAHLNFPKRVYEHDHGSDQYRRGLYTYWCRTFLHPSLAAFDAPSREECVVERAQSNTPLQALVLLNDPTYVEAARVLATRVLQEAPEDFQSQLDVAFQRALSRKPVVAERSVLGALHEKHLAEYSADPEAARQLLDVGESPVAGDLAPAELAAWTNVTRVILNLHESIMRY